MSKHQYVYRDISYTCWEGNHVDGAIRKNPLLHIEHLDNPASESILFRRVEPSRFPIEIARSPAHETNKALVSCTMGYRSLSSV